MTNATEGYSNYKIADYINEYKVKNLSEYLVICS